MEIGSTNQQNIERSLDHANRCDLNPIFLVSNEAGLREEIVVELCTVNNEPFRGSLTELEAKHGIYRDCLGFRDFSNFDGVRLSYRGIHSAAFKFKQPFNVDSLYDIKNFVYKRRMKTGGKVEVVEIHCKIKGIRSQDQIHQRHEREERSEDNSVNVFIEGCDYRIPEQTILDALSNWGEVISEIKEEMFEDPHDSEGTNRTGTYSVMMLLRGKFPQLLPLDGKRVKIFHKGITKLCTYCFGAHPRNRCSSEKVAWADYVKSFANSNPNLKKEFFGRWWKIIEDGKQTIEGTSRPLVEDFGVPRSKEHFNELLIEMIKTGMSYSMAESNLKDRNTAFVKACDHFDSIHQAK